MPVHGGCRDAQEVCNLRLGPAGPVNEKGYDPLAFGQPFHGCRQLWLDQRLLVEWNLKQGTSSSQTRPALTDSVEETDPVGCLLDLAPVLPRPSESL